jgi:hypothetical protein
MDDEKTTSLPEEKTPSSKHERDHWHSEYDKAVHERDHWHSQHDEAAHERNHWHSQHDKAVHERDHWHSRHDEAVHERDHWRSQYDEAVHERDRWHSQYDNAASKGDDWHSRHDEAVHERDHWHSRHDEAVHERDHWHSQYDEAVHERDHWHSQYDEAAHERDHWHSQYDDAAHERDHWHSQYDDAAHERDHWHSQYDDAAHERDHWRSVHDDNVGEQNALAERVAQLEHRFQKRLFYFVHLAKTAGVTLTNIFARNFGTGRYLEIDLKDTEEIGMTWPHSAVLKALARLTPDQIARLQAVWGHYRPDLKHELPRPCIMATMLRDPVRRVASAFNYSHFRQGNDPHSLDEFVAEVERGEAEFNDGDSNYMSRVLNDSLSEFAIIGVTEKFDETLLIIAEELGWALNELVYQRQNVTPEALAISDRTYQKLLDINLKDMQLYERAKAHLNGKISAYKGDFEKKLFVFRQLNEMYGAGASPSDLRNAEVRLTEI